MVRAELDAAIERTSRAFEGFYCGRYDTRAPSEDDLRAGRELKVIELKGATTEATHIYDPLYSVLDGWRVCANSGGSCSTSRPPVARAARP